MSTYTSYLMLTRDYSRTLTNLGKTSTVSRDAQYYQANIGKVKSVDDLMKDDRLYRFAMKAAGLDDMAYAKAFVRKVLMSDLNDLNSFANKLTDKRYTELASTFNFGKDGKVPVVSDIQSTLQEQEIAGLYNQNIATKDRIANENVTAYSAVVDTMTSVDEFFLPYNRKYLDMALTAYGMGDIAKSVSTDFIREILTRGVADMTSPLYEVTDERLKAKFSSFVSAFNFAPSGTVTAGGAQSITQKGATIAGYLDLSGEASEKTALLYAAETYRKTIPLITNVNDIVSNSFVLNYIKTAYDLTNASDASIIAALQSDPGDPLSDANQLGLGYRRLAEDFNFDASGNVIAGQDAQDAAGIQNTSSRYIARANSSFTTETGSYLTYALTINKPGWIENVDDLVTVLTGGNPNDLPATDPAAVPDVVAAAVRTFVFNSFGFNPKAQYSATFIRDVLMSDLNDPSSAANTAPEKAWAKLAAAFDFDPVTGDLAGTTVQTDAQLKEMSERFIGQGFGGVATAQQAKYAFKWEMNDIANVDDFLDSKSAFSFALVAYGFPKEQGNKEFFRQILTDPAFAAAQTDDPRVAKFAAAFSFESDGSLPPSGAAQTVLQFDTTVEKFMTTMVKDSPEYYLDAAAEYRTAIAGIRTVTDFLDDVNAPYFNMALSAFGIDLKKTSLDELRRVLSSDLLDATSPARKLGGVFLEFAQAFNFGQAGVVPEDSATQNDDQLNKLLLNFLSNNNPATVRQVSGASNSFKSRIDGLAGRAALSGRTAIDEFLNDAELYSYALIAHGLNPATESKADIRAVLTADKSRTSALVLGNPKYAALANSLNFDPDGSVGSPKVAQTTTDAALLARKYVAAFPTNTRPAWAPNRPTPQEELITAETDYYAQTIQTIGNVKDLTGDSRMVNYILKSFGYASNALVPADLNKILTSDLNDPKSFANASKDIRYREMAALFSFNTDGSTRRVPEQSVQSSGAVYKTYTSFLQQTLEIEQGKQNQGVRLALYLARKAPTLTSTYAILGDKALFEAVRTAIGMPNEAARADIDVLARTIEKKIKVADFKDPKKLEQFIRRFAAMYDVANSGGTGSSNYALGLIQGNSDTGFSQDTIASLQTMRARRF